MNEIEFKNLPQLIVALDSNDNSANYIHIKDTKDIEYYCPCCKGKIKPRAYKTNKNYKVQPHYYHIDGGCSEETYVHYICKNWLFESGCKFIINGIEYKVDHIETEKTLHTSFGDYRPDIIVSTTCGKVFYFEIKTTNKKTELYASKWDELGNDVVEVDTRYFINQKCSSSIPEFKLIYSDGQCFIKSYTRSDYDSIIAKRKLEWKRQDKLNYKIKWEKLDWFWIELQEYKNGNCSHEQFLSVFLMLEYEDVEFCWILIKKLSCIDKELKNEFRNIVNDRVKDKFNEELNFLNEKYSQYIKINYKHSYCIEKIGVCFNYDNSYVIERCKSWVLLPSLLKKVFDNTIIKIENELNYKKRDKFIKEYVNEERFPMWFKDTSIIWDTYNSPKRFKEPQYSKWNNDIPYEEIQNIILNEYEECVKNQHAVPEYALKKVREYIVEEFKKRNKNDSFCTETPYSDCVPYILNIYFLNYLLIEISFKEDCIEFESCATHSRDFSHE